MKRHLAKYFAIGFGVSFLTDLLSNYLILKAPFVDIIVATIVASITGGTILMLLDYIGVVE